jgi:hypothetical protein
MTEVTATAATCDICFVQAVASTDRSLGDLETREERHHNDDTIWRRKRSVFGRCS